MPSLVFRLICSPFPKPRCGMHILYKLSPKPPDSTCIIYFNMYLFVSFEIESSLKYYCYLLGNLNIKSNKLDNLIPSQCVECDN